MKKVTLFSAVSIDGYIAKKDGSVDWLDEIPNPDKLDFGYYDFYSGIDTTIMGRKTYEQVLGFDVGWPYPDCQSYIASRKDSLAIKTENTLLLSGDLKTEVQKLKEQPGKDIWLVGGGLLNSSFLILGLIDEMILSIIPVVLGDGLPIFPGEPTETSFSLVKSESFEPGVINLHYRRSEFK